MKREKEVLKPEDWTKKRPRYQFYMSCAISLLLLGSALWVVLLDTYSDATQKWAAGVIGTVVGYWLPKNSA